MATLRVAGAGDIFPVPMSVTAAMLRELKGQRVRVTFKSAAGGGAREGDVAGTLDAADGLVLFLRTAEGGTESVHHQSIETLEQI